MKRGRDVNRLFVFALFTFLSLPSVASSQQAPQCTAESLGQVACFVNKLCECKFERGGSMTGVPDAYKWDCDIKRPSCGLGADTPADLDAYMGPYPSAVGIDRSSDTTVINNKNGATVQD